MPVKRTYAIKITKTIKNTNCFDIKKDENGQKGENG